MEENTFSSILGGDEIDDLFADPEDDAAQ